VTQTVCVIQNELFLTQASSFWGDEPTCNTSGATLIVNRRRFVLRGIFSALNLCTSMLVTPNYKYLYGSFLLWFFPLTSFTNLLPSTYCIVLLIIRILLLNYLIFSKTKFSISNETRDVHIPPPIAGNICLPSRRLMSCNATRTLRSTDKDRTAKAEPYQYRLLCQLVSRPPCGRDMALK
jgi:hypothetical protein